MCVDLPDVMKLDVFRMRDVYFLRAARTGQYQGRVAKYREADFAGAANDIDMVGTLETAEIPAAAARHA